MTHNTPEFDVIARHFTRPAVNAVLGVGDDCALVGISRGMELAVSVDTMVSGTHFFPDVDPENLGHKALAVNLSDMAAMGAMPYWAMLALTLPKVDHDWLAAFSKGFFDLADEFEVSLIGGDTTRGPLTLTVTIMGEVPIGAALRRGGAKAGNDIWVSGFIGDAALAVSHRHGKLVLEESDYHEAVMRLYEPTPRVGLGQALRGLATAAIDVSDGLLADLGHICSLSKVGAVVELGSIPLSPIGARHVASDAGPQRHRGGRRRLRALLHRAPELAREHPGPREGARRADHAHRAGEARQGREPDGSRRKAREDRWPRIRPLRRALTCASSSRIPRTSSPSDSARDSSPGRRARSARSRAWRSTGSSRSCCRRSPSPTSRSRFSSWASGCATSPGATSGWRDHGAIVWDEVVAFLPLAAISSGAWWLQAIAFALFRLFDIWKPYPIRDLERNVKGGWGVMIDDIVAGFYAYVVFALFIIVVYKGFGYAG